MIEVILRGGEIFFGRFGMKSVARHGLARRQMLSKQISHSRQGFVAGDQLDLSRLYLRNSPPHLRKLCGGDFRRNVLRQAFD